MTATLRTASATNSTQGAEAKRTRDGAAVGLAPGGQVAHEGDLRWSTESQMSRVCV